MKLGEVFNEAAIPEITFEEPREFKFLMAAVETKGKHITLCGPSGCGKSTLALKAIKTGGISLSDCHFFNARSYSALAEPEVVFSAALGTSQDWDEIEDMMRLATFVIIDDFHHFHPEVRNFIGSRLKLWHEKGIRVFLIGIARTTQLLLQLDPELGIRNEPFEMGIQDETFIGNVIKKGEAALNFKFSDSTRTEIASGSKGIP
ncbi:MAG TPA: ATPase, partial [bacterium]|nr:ATPase [bacterium]